MGSPGPPQCLALPLERFTIHPSPAATIAGAATSERSSGALTFTSNMMLRRFTENPVSGAWIDAAALLTRISMCPPRASAASGMTRSRSVGSVRSATTTSTCVPNRAIRSRVALRLPSRVLCWSRVRAVRTMFAPSAAIRSASAAPMPLLEPVTRTRRPSKRPAIKVPFRRRSRRCIRRCNCSRRQRANDCWER